MATGKTVSAGFKVYVAVDFGTDGTGLAYALPNGKVYIHSKWKKWSKTKDDNKDDDLDTLTVKPKTAILLDKNGKFKTFGNNALQIYMNLKDTRLLLFEHFKMNLYTKPHYTGSNDDEGSANVSKIKTQLTAVNGKKYPSSKVFIEALKYLKEQSFQVFRKNKLQIKHNKDVCWILTVPAIWDDVAKAQMTEWAISAGMVDPNVDNQLLLRYEPDCAALSIQEELIKNALKNNTQSQLTSGQKYILCDAGGGTVDIACHQILPDCSVKELLAPSGGPWGDMYIDLYFIDMLCDIFKKEWIDEFKREEPNCYIELLDNFRRSKYQFHSKLDKINVTIPFEFIEFIEDKIEETDDMDYDDIEEIVDNFSINGLNNALKLDGESLHVSNQIWSNLLFDKLINATIEHCIKLLTNNAMNGCKYLCIVGGFGGIKYFQEKLIATFGKKSKYKLTVIIPKRPILAVLDGAARMAIKWSKNQRFVKSRILDRTYGDYLMSWLKPIQYNQCPSYWKVVNFLRDHPVTNEKKFKKVFTAYAEKGQTVRIDDKPLIKKYKRVNVAQKTMQFGVYSIAEPAPIAFDKLLFDTLVEDELAFPDYTNELWAQFEIFFGDTTLSIYGQVVGLPETRKKLNIKCHYKK